MACLQVKCSNPKCKSFNNEKAKVCKCGTSLAKGKTYYVQYTNSEGNKTREAIGSNKEAAKYRLRRVLNEIAEGRYIPKSPDAKTIFKELASWYLALDKVKAKQSYDRDKRSVDKLCAFFGGRRLKDITPSQVEKYVHNRLAESSYRGHLTKPATVIRELACMNSIYTNAILNGKAERNPVKSVKRPPENNERDRVLSDKEYERLIAECPEYIEPVIKLAYYTGMRRGEILGLTWGKVDLKQAIIRLNPGDTKTKQKREVHLCPELLEMFRAMPQGLRGVPVFTRKGKPITGSTIRVGLEIACKRAGIENFTFHDFRHTFATNMWRAGFPDRIIMGFTGHTTQIMLNRYTHVNGDDLKAAASKIGHHGHPGGHPTELNTISDGLRQA